MMEGKALEIEMSRGNAPNSSSAPCIAVCLLHTDRQTAVPIGGEQDWLQRSHVSDAVGCDAAAGDAAAGAGRDAEVAGQRLAHKRGREPAHVAAGQPAGQGVHQGGRQAGTLCRLQAG